MKSFTQHDVLVHNKKYRYTLTPKNKRVTFFECKAANIAQAFPNEDIASLLIDLPNLILAEKAYVAKHSEIIRFRISATDKKRIVQRAQKKGYASVSHYLRDLALTP